MQYLDIHYIKSIDSTQTFLVKALEQDHLKPPVLIYTHHQTDGIGSRNNTWTGIEGNLFFSLALPLGDLPSDLPMVSASIYYGFLIKSILNEHGSKVHLKWPNDLYLEHQKIGGIITYKKASHIIVGAGINMVANDSGYAHLDISLDVKRFFENLTFKLKENLLWNQVFKLYELEFDQFKTLHTTHSGGNQIALSDCVLNTDGSINFHGKKAYSLR